MSAPAEQFRDAIQAAGIQPPDAIIADGVLHRFASDGRRGDDAGWYVLHDDGIPAGCFGCFRLNLSQRWRADVGRNLTLAEVDALRTKQGADRLQREGAEAQRRTEAAAKAIAIWGAAQPATADHPYLARKRVSPVPMLREIPQAQAVAILGYPPRAGGEFLYGRLLIAPMTVDGQTSTAELIDEAGRKSAIAGGAKCGAFWTAQPLPDGDGTGLTLLIGEGIATVLSASNATGKPTVAALSCGNLESVARQMRARYPMARLIVLADLGNGQTDAEKAARTTGASVAVPDFGMDRPEDATDFNDMYQLCGRDAVARAINDAKSPEAMDIARPATNALAGDPKDTSIRLINGADLRPEPVRWLWDGWLAAGKFHVMAGAPGAGKTTIALALAATATVGGDWPDGTQASPGNVLIWSGEDDPRDTLAPRLLASGADMTRVHFVGDVTVRDTDRSFDPARDLPVLMDEAAKIGGIVLAIVDPVVSAVGGDSHKNTEVRRALQPLVDLATRLDCAVLGISHFSKGSAGRNPIERVTGSVAFGAVARVVMVVATSQRGVDQNTRLIVRAKSNIGPDSGGFEYDIAQRPLDKYPEVVASYVVWGAPVEGTAMELLKQAEVIEPEERRDSPRQFLQSLLETGPRLATNIVEQAEAHGYSRPQMGRAANDLGVIKKKLGLRGGWEWRLPEDDAVHTEDPTEEEASPSLSSTPSKMTPTPEDAEDDAKSCWGLPLSSAESSGAGANPVVA